MCLRNLQMRFLILSLCVVGTLPCSAIDLALNWKPEPEFGGFYQAGLDKEFEKRNLQVQILEGGSGTPTVQMLAHHKVDYAIVSGEEILTNNDRNPQNQVVAIYASFQTNPQVIMCRPEVHAHTVSEIFSSETTLAWQSGLAYAIYLKKKYPSNKTKIVPYLGGINPYLSETQFCQQGFATSETLLAEEAGRPAQVFLVADEGFNPYTAVLTTSAENLKKNPEQVKNMVEAVRAGWEHYLQDPGRANKFMAQLNKSLSPSTFEKGAKSQLKFMQTSTPAQLGKMTVERWKKLIEQLKQLGIIKSDLKPENQFL